MEIVKFESADLKEKNEAIDFVMENIKNCTQFVFIYSTDNLNTVYHEKINLSNVEYIGLLDVIKHKALHQVLPDDDDGEEKDLPFEESVL